MVQADVIVGEISTFQREKCLAHCYKSNGQCLACVHLLRYLRTLPTIRVHPELDGCTLDIVHSFNFTDIEKSAKF